MIGAARPADWVGADVRDASAPEAERIVIYLPITYRYPDQPYAIGLRLSHRAARELSDRTSLLEFQRWLGQKQCYVFTINGFPFGDFHGRRVKEQVYVPDWKTRRPLGAKTRTSSARNRRWSLGCICWSTMFE